MVDYVKLDSPPVLCIQFPTCSACEVDLELCEGWECPVCGTRWSASANDGDQGELYESWSGEKLDSPTVTHPEASLLGIAWERAQREKIFASLTERRAE